MNTGTLIIDIEGETLNEEERDLLKAASVAGVILFARSTRSFDQTRALCDEIRSVREDLFVCLDQEGGRVMRLTDGVAPIPDPGTIGRFYDYAPEAALRCARMLSWRLAYDIRRAGFDFSFAPVLDIDYNNNTVIGARSFGSRAEMVAALGAEWIAGMQEGGSPTVGKHYPGHGYAAEDSHVAVPHDSRSFEDIRDSDLLPFARLAPVLDAVMPSHVIYDQVDISPAGFSNRWLDYLRRDLDFDGVVITDDLNMEGASVAGGIGERVRRALSVGCDFAIVCNDREAVRISVPEVADDPALLHADDSRARYLLGRRSDEADVEQLEKSRRVADALGRGDFETALAELKTGGGPL
ncbi:MAG: beta-N-acetylhexosaminidase [Spirochaetales bacterium]